MAEIESGPEVLKSPTELSPTPVAWLPPLNGITQVNQQLFE